MIAAEVGGVQPGIVGNGHTVCGARTRAKGNRDVGRPPIGRKEPVCAPTHARMTESAKNMTENIWVFAPKRG